MRGGVESTGLGTFICSSILSKLPSDKKGSSGGSDVQAQCFCGPPCKARPQPRQLLLSEGINAIVCSPPRWGVATSSKIAFCLKWPQCIQLTPGSRFSRLKKSASYRISQPRTWQITYHFIDEKLRPRQVKGLISRSRITMKSPPSPSIQYSRVWSIAATEAPEGTPLHHCISPSPSRCFLPTCVLKLGNWEILPMFFT